MLNESGVTLVMVDDNADEIFLTCRQARRDGVVNNFVAEKKPEHLFETLAELGKMGVATEKIMILLDINMPRVNGFETLKKLRADPKYGKVPIIMLTASDDENDMLNSLQFGASGYLVKPFRTDELFAALASLPKLTSQRVQ